MISVFLRANDCKTNKYLLKPNYSILLITLVLLCKSNISQAQNFTLPIEGEPFVDWTIVNYKDLDNSINFSDWNGGNYTYNGHDAIDFTLPNFAAMDKGVSVLAAGNGVVIDLHDGEFDRWSRVNPNPGRQANWLLIDHGNGVRTEYYHLKKHSLLVSVGDSVQKGQKIAEVGSSGFSSDPHLHFAVYENLETIETYQNPNYWWEKPLEYAGNVDGVLDSGIMDHYPSTSELVDRPVDVTSFNIENSANPLVVSWSNLHWNNTASELIYQLVNPNGAIVNQFNFSPSQIRFGWWYVGFTLPSDATSGSWSIRALVNDALWLEDNFLVIDNSPILCNGQIVTVNLNLGQTPTPGDDIIMGTAGADDIRGKAGNDTICGMGGADFIHGNSGDDWIDGGNGVDNIRGGQGSDTLFSGNGGTVGTESRIFGGTGDDRIYGGSDADDLRGGRGVDVIHGEGGADLIIGNDGNDMLYGGNGADTMTGGGGSDELYGNAGTDSLNGGSGNSDFCDSGGQSSDTDTNCEVF